MNHRNLARLVVILSCLLWNLSVIADNVLHNGNNPTIQGNQGKLAVNVAGWDIAGKRLVVVGYGSPAEYDRNKACAGYDRALSFVENALKPSLTEAKKIDVANLSIEIIDGGYRGETWVEVYGLNPDQEFPGAMKDATPPQGRCAK